MVRLSESPVDLSDAIRDFGDHPVQVSRENATFEQAHELMQKDPDSEERSQFQWFRLPNGDLILGFYPQGDAYFNATAAIDI